MSVGTFELREIEWTTPRAILIVLWFVTACIHFALATTTNDSVFAILAVGLLSGFVVYFTDLWMPVYHLFGALYTGMMALVWLLAGMPLLTLGVLEMAIQTILFGLFVYVFFSEGEYGKHIAGITSSSS